MQRFGKILARAAKRVTFSADGAYRLWVTALKVLELVVVCTLILGTVLWLLQQVPALDYTIRQWIPESSRKYARIVGLLHFSLLVSLWTLLCSLLLGCFMRIFYLTRFVYKLLGSVGKLILFWVPFVVLIGWVMDRYWPNMSWQSSSLVCAIPAGIFFHGCVSFTEVCMPELLPLARKTAGLLKEGALREGWNRRKKAEMKTEKPTEEQLFAEVLGLKGAVSFEEIKKQYHVKARQYHPDKVLHLGTKLREAAEQEMKEINRAYAFFEKKHKKK